MEKQAYNRFNQWFPQVDQAAQNLFGKPLSPEFKIFLKEQRLILPELRNEGAVIKANGSGVKFAGLDNFNLQGEQTLPVGRGTPLQYKNSKIITPQFSVEGIAINDIQLP